MLAVTNTSPWASAIGSRNTDRRRSASADALLSDRVVGSSTTYSSPDNLATIASRGTVPISRSATILRTSSPAEWPRLSLMFLNRSRSTKNSVGSRSARHSSLTYDEMRSSSSTRLGRPVSASVYACFSSSDCASLLALTDSTTRSVTALASTSAEIDRTIWSAVLFGPDAASTMTGKTNDEVVMIKRPSSRCESPELCVCSSDLTLGCRNAAATAKYPSV